MNGSGRGVKVCNGSPRRIPSPGVVVVAVVVVVGVATAATVTVAGGCGCGFGGVSEDDCASTYVVSFVVIATRKWADKAPGEMKMMWVVGSLDRRQDGRVSSSGVLMLHKHIPFLQNK